MHFHCQKEASVLVTLDDDEPRGNADTVGRPADGHERDGSGEPTVERHALPVAPLVCVVTWRHIHTDGLHYQF